MGDRSYVTAPAAGYTLLVLFVDIDTATQASDMTLVQAPVVAFSMENGGLARPVPVLSIDALNDGESEFKAVALQLPDSSIVPFTRGWIYKDTRFANIEARSGKTIATLAAWRAAAWALLQAQLNGLTVRVAEERRRKAELSDNELRVAIAQNRVRQANLDALQRRRDDVDAQAVAAAARAAEVAALLEAAGKP